MPVPPLLSFGSWIGGDRDGNPNVTPQMTAAALALMKDACLRHHEARIRALGSRITLSARVAGEPAELRDLLESLEQRFPDVAALAPRAQPRGALPAPVQAARRARARDAQGLGRRLRPARGAARRPARRRAGAALAERVVRRRGRAARRHPPGRGLRLSLRAARRPRERRRPPRRARRDPRRARRAGGLRGAARGRADRAPRARDRRPPPADPARHQRLQRVDARGRRDVPHAVRPAARRAPRHDRLLHHLQHDRARRTCSRCCCS